MSLSMPDFESMKHENDQGQPYWSARELSEILGYGKNWRGFENVIKKDQIFDENLAILTHHDVAREVRTASERIHQKDTKDLPRAFDLRKELEARRRAAQKQVTKAKQAEEGGQQSLF